VTTQLPWPAAALLGSTWQGIRTVLARCVREQREHGLPGTLMLAGAPGLGREALAVELAATLVCRAGGEPGCGCSSCERIRRGIHPDVVVVTVEAGKSDITVAQAHEVVGTLAHHPYEGVRRVFILASCHTPPLHADAASALLKSLEEPPPLVTFLLLASNPARVLPTVVSRAVQIRVPPPERHELLPALAMIGACSEEQAAALLDALGGNAALAGQVAAFATADDVARIAGLVGEALSGDAAAVVEAARTVESALREAGEDPRRAALAHELLPAILVRLASAAGAGTPETAVELAATLLAAERRRLALRLDAESVVAGVFAQSAVSRRLGLPEAENG
jgi:DNA polymerase III delta prime subunit